MKIEQHDLLIIGGGPAGLAAAYGAYSNGVKDIVIIERAERLGGILNQCIHNGFGLHRFKEELTGPEYAQRWIDMLQDTSVKVESNTMAIDLSKDHVVTLISSSGGLKKLCGKAVVLAMGCRERSRGAISIPGDRCAGIYTAGTAQRYCNLDGLMVGKRVVILGSGDIGLIMARRMTLEGAKVLADVELCPYSNGLNRNIVQCLNDYDIPLYLSHTVIDIRGDEGDKRVKEVVIAEVDKVTRKPIPGSEITFECDTLLLSVGLIPENELSKKAGIELDNRTKGPLVADNLETTVDGIFACGNVLQVHDLVDNVSAEGEKAGKNAAEYVKNGHINNRYISAVAGDGLGYICPQLVRLDSKEDGVDFFFRVRVPNKNVHIEAASQGQVLKTFPRLVAVPSEMESIHLTKDDLKNAGEVIVSVKEGLK